VFLPWDLAAAVATIPNEVQVAAAAVGFCCHHWYDFLPLVLVDEMVAWNGPHHQVLLNGTDLQYIK
jgi:hypothetical protein